MKNTIKMSLVAAVAVAGLTSNVAAKPLEEAIKNVDVSGSVVYRYNDYGDDKNAKNKTDNNYKIGLSLKSKVNDYVTATVRVVAGDGFANLSTQDAADDNVPTEVSQANFTVKTDYATVIAGKQGLTTPWTVAIDSDGNEQTGTGLLALVPAGPVTVAAAYFNQTNLDDAVSSSLNTDIMNATVPNPTDAEKKTTKENDEKLNDTIDSLVGSSNIATVGVLGTVGPVAFDAWYLDADDVFDSYTVGAKATIDMITAELRYASLTLEDDETATLLGHYEGKDNSIIMAKVGAKMDVFSAYLQYGKTDKEGGLTALDSDAKTTMTGWNTNIHNKADADYFRVGAGMDVMENLNVSLNYADLEYRTTGADNVLGVAANDIDSTDIEETELYTQITHKMGTNLVTYVRLGMFDQEVDGKETVDATAGRLQIEYKF